MSKILVGYIWHDNIIKPAMGYITEVALGR